MSIHSLSVSVCVCSIASSFSLDIHSSSVGRYLLLNVTSLLFCSSATLIIESCIDSHNSIYPEHTANFSISKLPKLIHQFFLRISLSLEFRILPKKKLGNLQGKFSKRFSAISLVVYVGFCLRIHPKFHKFCLRIFEF